MTFTLHTVTGRSLRVIMGLTGTRGQWSGEDYIKRSFVICTPHQIVFGWSKNKKEVSKACSKYGERRGAYTVFVWRPEGKRQFGRPKRRCEDNIKVDLQEQWCGSMDWIYLAEDWESWRIHVNAVLNLRVQYKGNFLTN